MTEKKEPKRKPLPGGVREKLKEGTKTEWVRCGNCGCQFEVTERKAQEFKYSKGPKLCYDCFNARPPSFPDRFP